MSLYSGNTRLTNDLTSPTIKFCGTILVRDCKRTMKHASQFFLDYKKYKTNLQFIRIYFDTIIFDMITKDSRVKFTDMLAGVGGTMGLLTGFSIISGLEIVYFAAKIILNLFNKK